MANISFDSQSFIIDGKRQWLVCGALHYPRIARGLWRDRIRAAKQAGINTIETYVFWNVHEPEQGRFDFEGQADLRHFIELIHEEGMYCFFRPGPYVCSEWDFGGLPAWLHELPDMKIRQNNPAFIQACAKYMDAVMKQVADLQITRDGPIILMQVENEWFCHNDQQAVAYHEELARFMREGGCEVPLTNCNNLWQPVQGTMDTWNGWNNIRDDCRQLRVARPEAPRMVSEFWPGWFDAWGEEHASNPTAQAVMRRMCEVASTGAMYNLYMFHGGSNFGFYGGRTVGNEARFMTQSYDYNAPLLEAGGRGRKYELSKRVNMFCSQFGFMFANLRPDQHHAVTTTGIQAVQQTGSMGKIVFITRDDQTRQNQTEILTPLGQRLPIHFGKDYAAWIVLDANLEGGAMLDFTNLRPYALINRRMLVLYGPAASDALLSVDGAVIDAKVPAAKTVQPLIEQFDNLTVVILNDRQVDAAYVQGNRLYVGVQGFDENDEPKAHPDFSSAVLVRDTGDVERQRMTRPTKPRAPKLGTWSFADTLEYIEGTAPRFAAITGPRPLELCGAYLGYGWYRMRFKRPRAGQVMFMMPEAADRIHLFHKKKLLYSYGFGPGAQWRPQSLKLPGGEIEMIALADNLGRYNYGQVMGERKGIFGHLLSVKALKKGKMQTEVMPCIDPFELDQLIYHHRLGDRTPRPRHTWTFEYRKSAPIVMTIEGARASSVILVNDQPIAIDGASGTVQRLVIEAEHLKRGKNTLTLATYRDEPTGAPDLNTLVNLYEITEVITDKAQWWYARWQMPRPEAFGNMPARTTALPSWYRTTFKITHTDQPLFLEMKKLSKGQIYLNGHNVGRYFINTANNAAVPPQDRYYLPEPWLNVDDENELILFDEHGKLPTDCKLVYDPLGPYGDQ